MNTLKNIILILKQKEFYLLTIIIVVSLYLIVPTKKEIKTEIKEVVKVEVVEKEKIVYREAKTKDLSKNVKRIKKTITNPNGQVIVFESEKVITDKKEKTNINVESQKEKESNLEHSAEVIKTEKTGDHSIAAFLLGVVLTLVVGVPLF